MQCSFENCPGSLKHCSRAKSKNHNCVGQNVSVCVLRVTNTGQRGFEAQVTNLRSGMDLSKCVPIAIDVQLVCNVEFGKITGSIKDVWYGHYYGSCTNSVVQQGTERKLGVYRNKDCRV